MVNSSHPQSKASRRTLLVAAALGAGVAGVGLAWWRGQQQIGQENVPSTSGDVVALAALWSLELPTPAGKKLALASLRGKPLLINFWATWCPPCVEELPLIDAFYQANVKNGWQVLGLAVDQLAAVNSFLTKMPISFPIVLAGAPGIEMSKSMGNLSGGLPFTLVVNSSGNVAQRKIGRVTPEDLKAWATLE